MRFALNILVICGLGGGFWFSPSSAQNIEEVFLNAPRLTVEENTNDLLDQDDIRTSPSFRLDEILKTNPSFSLFRRAGSLSGHPTIQGPSLAAIGANGAARALVLLDGIPLNDPFGGWVYWSSIDPGLLQMVQFLKGGSSGPWGSGGLSGTIEMVSRTPEEFLELEGKAGSFSTFNLNSRVAFTKNGTTVILGAGYFDTSGFFLVPESQRGSVDVPAASNSKNFSGRISTPLSRQTRFEFHARYFSENRVNGLVLSTNQTEAIDAGLRLIQNSPDRDLNWEMNVYFRDRQFENSFASVDSPRTTTRQVLDQFDVPASEVGLNGRLRIKTSETVQLETGFDVRLLKGFTNEHARNLGAGFTRLRVAGGNQILIGVFLEASKTFLEERLEFKVETRLDFWTVNKGILRVESLEMPGQILRDDPILDRKNLTQTGKFGGTYKFDEKIELRAFFFTGFRVPTLNELFRPFRVGNDITEANPNLNPEKLKGVEAGLTYAPNDQIEIDISFTLNRVKGGIGNITLAFGPGFFPPTGFVPAGGILRKRQNINLITNKAFVAQFLWHPETNIEISFNYLFQDSTIKKFSDMPALVGKTLIQTPRHKASLAFKTEITGNLFFTSQIRFEAKQFDDDQNLRVLPEIFVTDFFIRYRLTEKVGLTFSALNIFDEQIVSALNSGGLITLDQPRNFWGGIEVSF